MGRYKKVYKISKEYTSGITALYIACAKQNEKLVRYFIKRNANVNAKNKTGKTALHVACTKNSSNIVKLLLEQDVDINKQDNIGNTALHLACCNKNEEIVKLLLSKNANVNITNNAQVTPLHLACYKGSENIVKILLRNGAKVNQKSRYGITPLQYACYIGNYNMVKLLLDANADTNIKNERGELAINIACLQNHPKLVNELIKAQSKVPLNIIDWAIQKEEVDILKNIVNRKDIAKYLVKKLIVSNKVKLLREIRRAKINIDSQQEVDGASLLEIAIRNNNLDIINILMAHNFGGINNTIAKLNELVNNVCVNDLLKHPKNNQMRKIKHMKIERECENILDVIYLSKKM